MTSGNSTVIALREQTLAQQFSLAAVGSKKKKGSRVQN